MAEETIGSDNEVRQSLFRHSLCIVFSRRSCLHSKLVYRPAHLSFYLSMRTKLIFSRATKMNVPTSHRSRREYAIGWETHSMYHGAYTTIERNVYYAAVVMGHCGECLPRMRLVPPQPNIIVTARRVVLSSVGFLYVNLMQ